MTRSRLLAVGALVGAVAMPAIPAEAHAARFGKRTLHRGMHGHDVRVLQRYLDRVGVPTTADGQFGPRTRHSVRRWERDVQRRVNGRVSRPDARVLKHEVRSGATVTPTPAPAPAASADTATLDADGHAVAPASAPPEVQDVIAAANHIVGKPYRYGGGHGQWEDSGYDCSGSESYALHGGGFVDSPMTSTGFESWGLSGPGTWITSYANSGHSFMVVAGLRFDTGWNNAGKGPRWSDEMRPTDGYVVRHPDGF